MLIKQIIDNPVKPWNIDPNDPNFRNMLLEVRECGGFEKLTQEKQDEYKELYDNYIERNNYIAGNLDMFVAIMDNGTIVEGKYLILSDQFDLMTYMDRALRLGKGDDSQSMYIFLTHLKILKELRDNVEDGSMFKQDIRVNTDHGAFITVEKEIGEGAFMNVSLPITVDPMIKMIDDFNLKKRQEHEKIS